MTKSQAFEREVRIWSVVEFGTGRRFRVFDIAWGRDMGDEHDHITANISPGPPEAHRLISFLRRMLCGLQTRSPRRFYSV